eukprot:TRINITY_DN11065_c0_g1_i2.p1 TRINITY_DN11065_c0_g1~~TRINITY_DN11065_c0_g1_i2.p1  ORF type:complete len:388 (+),score=88.53 TRINITY_DN11065_c0_g1_i2:3-1166(+)
MIWPCIALDGGQVVDVRTRTIVAWDPLAFWRQHRVPVVVLDYFFVLGLGTRKSQALLPGEVRTHQDQFLVSSPAERVRPALPTVVVPAVPGEHGPGRSTVRQGETRGPEEEALTLAAVRRLAQVVPVVVAGRLSQRVCEELLAAGVARLCVDAASEELIRSLPRERVMAQFSVPNDECDLEDVIRRLAPFVCGFSVHRAHAGGLGIPPSDFFVAQLKHFCWAAQASGGRAMHILLSGGISTATEVVRLHKLGIDVVTHTATLEGTMSVPACLMGCAGVERDDGLVWTALCNGEGQVLGLVFSTQETLKRSLETQRAVFLASEGHGTAPLELLRLELAGGQRLVRMYVRLPAGGRAVCALRGTSSCFGALPVSMTVRLNSRGGCRARE